LPDVISRPAVVTVTIGALLLFGCANPGYGSDNTRNNLEQAGLTDEQARCVTRALETKIGIKRLETHSEPTETEFQKALDALDDCGVSVSSDGAGSS
jgi:hypothetical protein